ncbi:MAG: DNA polymerase III subunit alpha [Alphaproteobacteria bacterium]|nr:DNA polymerase III subunit alpha [Alphaproteobacteria bacterium]
MISPAAHGGYAELSTFTNFSFLRGASHPDEMIAQAAALGLAAVAITDVNSFAGIVRAHVAARQAGVRLVVGVRLQLSDEAPDILAWPQDRTAYGRICRLLTRGKRRAAKGNCLVATADILELGAGTLFAVAPETPEDEGLLPLIRHLREAFPGDVWLAAARTFGPDDVRRLNGLARIAAAAGVPLLAVNHALYHDPVRRCLQDVLTCIREKTTIDAAGRLLEANAERCLKSPAEMARLFADYPDAVRQSLEIADRARFSLDELRYEYPKETSDGEDPQEALERLAWIGARGRFPDGLPDKVRTALVHELGLIARLQYAPYFLTVYDIVRYARSRGILCQGRGSAANSAVCYCLGITAVDPSRMDLLFERFISEERREPPDIDVDFEHQRREEVIQYIYEKYGRERAGIAATVICYRARSALRETGKAMGLTEDAVAALSGMTRAWRDGRIRDEAASDSGLDVSAPRVAMTLALARELMGFPRHLSQHTGGFVVTDGPLEETIPIGNGAMPDRTFVEWDKDDLDALGIIKVDVLGLGMLSCIAKSFAFLRAHYGVNLDLATTPAEESAVYDMICRADTLGVFQIESRAQMTMLPRLRPRTFYDLVIEVAIVRPGPIQGDMVHPYLRRRRGEEKVEFPSKDLEKVLGKTLGVPLFQEQAMKIAIIAGGFTPTEADQLRRAMATFRKTGTIHTFGEKLVEGMKARGYDAAFAERCFKQIEGFGEYGFPESHAASFALIVYVSCWLKCRYPDVFLAAMLNAQPLGFYAPAQLVRDAREHGVDVRRVDVNSSGWDATLELNAANAQPIGERLHPSHLEMTGEIRTHHAVRLGFRQIKGASEDAAVRICAARAAGGPFDSVRDLWLRAGVSRAFVERLADADAFGSIGLSRRDALWAAKGLDAGTGRDEKPLFLHAATMDFEAEASLPTMPMGEEVIHDYRTLRLSLKAHPIIFLRDNLDRRQFIRNEILSDTADGRLVRVGGLVLVRQRPGTASGVIFATLEDETGVANIVIWPRVFERFRRVVLAARFMGIEGRVQREGEVIHVVADRLVDLTPMLSILSEDYGEAAEAYARADEFRHGGERADPRIAASEKKAASKERLMTILPKSRDFH